MHILLLFDMKQLVVWRKDGDCGCMPDLVFLFFSSKYYHQSYWHSMVYVQPVPPASSVEAYPAYAEPAHVLDQSVPQLYDAGRAEVHQVPLDAPTNG